MISRRTLGAAGVAVTVASVGALGVGGASGASPFDHVNGGGKLATTTENNLEISAKSGPNGENPSGHFRFQDHTNSGGQTGARWFKASVTCLAVSGNVATIVGEIEKSKDSFAVGRYWVVRVIDHGNGNTDDELRNGPLGANLDPRVCDASQAASYSTVYRGNVSVSDAQ